MSNVRRGMKSVCVALLALGALSSAQSYKTIELGSLGGKNSEGFGINDSGQVVGYSQFSYSRTDFHAFLWTEGKGMQDLGTLDGGPFSVAAAINNIGWVTGTFFLADGKTTHAFLWTPGKGMQDLGTLGGANSNGSAINRFGQIVGWSNTASGATHAFLWTQGQGMQDLGTLGSTPGLGSVATGITDDGAVTGGANTAIDSSGVGFLWTSAGGMRELKVLGGLPGSAQAINNHRWIAGQCFPPDSTAEAFVQAPHGMVGQLIASGGAYAININGAVVGATFSDSHGDAAFLWTPTGGTQDLGMLIPPHPGKKLIIATAINNGGKIVVNENISALGGLGGERPLVLIPITNAAQQ
jgi:probable HAF family extracellular repeat protein